MNRPKAALNLASNSAFEAIYRKGRDWQLLLAGIGVVFFSQFVLIAGGESSDGTIPNSGRFGLILGFLMVAIAAYFFNTRLRYVPWGVSFPRNLRFNIEGSRKLIFGVGVFAFAFLILRLLGGSKSGDDLWIWIVGLLGCASPFAPSVTRIMVGLRVAWRSIRWFDVVIVGVLTVIFLAVNATDLDDWYYASIGDEYNFYELAVHFSQNGIDDPFSQRGVYDFHPRLGIVLKSIPMDVFGQGHFGWKFGSMLVMCLVILGVYVVGTWCGGRIAGAVASTIIAFSHYLGQLAHVGYDHTDSLLPVILAVGFFFVATRTKSPLMFYAAGVLVGMCFYTNVAARVILPTIAVFAVLQQLAVPNRQAVKWLIPLVVGIGLAVLPMLLVDGNEVITRMFGRVLGGQGEISDLSIYERIASNITFNLFAFNFNEHSSHYISGSLLDSISGTLAVVATGFALGRFRDPMSSFLIIWLALVFAGAGGLSPYDWHAAITRLFPMMLPLSLLAGLFISKFIWPIQMNISWGDNNRIFNPKVITVVTLTVVGAVTLVENYQRAEYETPMVFHQSPVAVTIGGMQSETCGYVEHDRIAIVSRDQHVVRRILNAYDPGSVSLYPNEAGEVPGTPLLLDHQQAAARGFPDAEDFGCIIFSHPWEVEPRQLLSAIQSANPRAVTIPFSDQSGLTTITILRVP